MDWYMPCAYDHVQKTAFHRIARNRLAALADALGWRKDSFDLRSNAGGPAVSGEITLHHEQVYVQVSQPATGWDTGILIRRCKGREDYHGGPNHFAPLRMLDDLEALSVHVRELLPA